MSDVRTSAIVAYGNTHGAREEAVGSESRCLPATVRSLPRQRLSHVTRSSQSDFRSRDAASISSNRMWQEVDERGALSLQYVAPALCGKATRQSCQSPNMSCITASRSIFRGTPSCVGFSGLRGSLRLRINPSDISTKSAQTGLSLDCSSFRRRAERHALLSGDYCCNILRTSPCFGTRPLLPQDVALSRIMGLTFELRLSFLCGPLASCTVVWLRSTV